MATEGQVRAGYLYILRPHMLINGQRIIKIGSTTRSVAEKIRHLEGRSSISYEELYSVHVADARTLERQLHARYADRQLEGGSQGFFRMEPEEVIPEIDRVAAELSRSWTARARNAERSAYLRKIGASRFKTSLTVASNIIWLLATLLVGYGAVFSSPVAIPRSTLPWALALSLAISAVAVWFVIGFVKRLVETRYFSQKFGDAIRRKDQELREKYPLT